MIISLMYVGRTEYLMIFLTREEQEDFKLGYGGSVTLESAKLSALSVQVPSNLNCLKCSKCLKCSSALSVLSVLSALSTLTHSLPMHPFSTP